VSSFVETKKYSPGTTPSPGKELAKKVQLWRIGSRPWAFQRASNQPRFYAATNFLKMAIKYLNLTSFIQVSTIKDEKSPEKFHYIKTVSSNVVAQPIAFQVVSICWQGDDPLPLKSWLNLTHSLLKAANFDTFCLVVPQP